MLCAILYIANKFRWYVLKRISLFYLCDQFTRYAQILEQSLQILLLSCFFIRMQCSHPQEMHRQNYRQMYWYCCQQSRHCGTYHFFCSTTCTVSVLHMSHNFITVSLHYINTFSHCPHPIRTSCERSSVLTDEDSQRPTDPDKGGMEVI